MNYKEEFLKTAINGDIFYTGGKSIISKAIIMAQDIRGHGWGCQLSHVTMLLNGYVYESKITVEKGKMVSGLHKTLLADWVDLKEDFKWIVIQRIGFNQEQIDKMQEKAEELKAKKKKPIDGKIKKINDKNFFINFKPSILPINS